MGASRRLSMEKNTSGAIRARTWRSPQFLKSRLVSCFFCVSLACIRHYSPRLGRHTRPDLAVRSEHLTPPRISPSCPHCLRLWLGRGTIVGRMRSWRGCLPRHPLGRMGTARHLVCRFDKVQSKRLFLLGFLLLLLQVGLGASGPGRFSLPGSSAVVILLPVIRFSRFTASFSLAWFHCKSAASICPYPRSHILWLVATSQLFEQRSEVLYRCCQLILQPSTAKQKIVGRNIKNA